MHGACLGKFVVSVARDPHLHAYASQYLQEPSKALIDDVVKVMDAPPDKPLM
ncbi:DUF3077 domain-containing protein [Pseudomonas sp. CFBP13508]|uniref:DUF3077 domain-containing protein n=1 Tax=Pseudomonas sp. CFBP13508 TaxID=2184009 RepID=UPI001F4F84BE|nr:DUF3077 domain-containing protein [Pseudomonas sp. CFBP13508]